MVAAVEPAARTAPGHGPLTPALYRVVERQVELDDVVTLSLEPEDGPAPPFAGGQFNMLTAFGVGEIAISISSAPGDPGPLRHTVRDVGAVTAALCASPVGAVVGVRGPFGTDWGVDGIDPAADAVIVAGGIGLAPLRGAVDELVARRRGTAGGGVFVLVGARSPDQVLFPPDLERWRADGAHVGVTVDAGAPGYDGPVGVVTSLLPEAPFDAERAVALVCGPEIMMRFAVRSLLERGVDPGRILVSLERNMQCGVGLCGHCQLGPLLLCRDGPVVPYGGVAEGLLGEHRR